MLALLPPLLLVDAADGARKKRKQAGATDGDDDKVGNQELLLALGGVLRLVVVWRFLAWVVHASACAEASFDGRTNPRYSAAGKKQTAQNRLVSMTERKAAEEDAAGAAGDAGVGGLLCRRAVLAAGAIRAGGRVVHVAVLARGARRAGRAEAEGALLAGVA